MFLFSHAMAEEIASVSNIVEAETSSPLAEEIATVSDIVAAGTADPSTPLERFDVLGPTGWITVISLIVLVAIMIGMSITRKTWTAKSLAYAALSIALSFVLSYVKMFEMPQGGSVTLASMLPIMLFAAAYGVGPGLLAGAAYGLLQYLQGGWFVHPIQFLLDYPIAFALIGLAGVYKYLPKAWQSWSLYACMIVGALGRALSATLAGILYWDSAPWASLVYNGTYLIPDTLICIMLAVFVGKRVMKIMKS